MNLTYTYKLRLTKEQEARIDRWIGVCRLVWNMALEIKEDAYKKGIKISFVDLERQIKEIRKIDWIKDAPVDSLHNQIKNLERSYKAFFKGAGFPKYKSKKMDKSLPLRPNKTDKTARVLSPISIRLPKIGAVKIFKDRLPDGEITMTTIIKKLNAYYLTISFKTQEKPLPTNDNQIGVDLGISKFCVLSNGEATEHPQFLQSAKKSLRIAQKKLSRAKKGGSNYKKKALVVARLHLKVARLRNDFLQKLSTKIIRGNGVVFVESLNIKGMVRSNLSGKISDSGWGNFTRMLRYKSELYGRRFAEVNARHTSQECFKCGHTSPNNRKTQADFDCQKCGHKANADLNAAKNILRRGQRLLAQSTDMSLRLAKVPETDASERLKQLDEYLNQLNKQK